jgi:hypothetical protein
MFIKLTNATEEFAGEVLIINTDHIISIIEIQEKKDNVEVSKTNLYTITQQAWVVEEPVNEVYKLIKENCNGG